MMMLGLKGLSVVLAFPGASWQVTNVKRRSFQFVVLSTSAPKPLRTIQDIVCSFLNSESPSSDQHQISPQETSTL